MPDLVAETAADVRRDDPDLALRQPDSMETTVRTTWGAWEVM